MRNGPTIADGADAVLDNHRFVRDGSFWICVHRCGARQPFPSAIPAPGAFGPCVPRRWGDGDPATDDGTAGGSYPDRAGSGLLPNSYRVDRAGRSVLARTCPRCNAERWKRCWDLGSTMRTTLRPHRERREIT